MRIAVDTNVLAYIEGVDGPDSMRAAADALKRLAAHEIAIPVQVLGELFRVLRRKGAGSLEARAAAVRGGSRQRS